MSWHSLAIGFWVWNPRFRALLFWVIPQITVNYSVAGASAFGTSNSPPLRPRSPPLVVTGRLNIQRLSDGQQRLRLGVSSAALSKKSIGGRAFATASSCSLESTSFAGHFWAPLQPSQDLSFLCCHQAPCQGGRGVREQCVCGTPYGVGGQSCSARCRPELSCRWVKQKRSIGRGSWVVASEAS